MAVRGKKTVPKPKKADAGKSGTKKKNRGGRPPGPTAAAKLRISERQEIVRQLVCSGNFSYRQIAEFCKKKGFPSSNFTVCKDINDILERNREFTDRSTQDWIAVELETLSELQQTFYVEAKNRKDAEAGNLVLRIIRERDRYTQASKYAQSQAAAAEQLAAFLGVKPEELPDGSDGEV